jgi:DNA-binding PadR family transcriptional regulator
MEWISITVNLYLHNVSTKMKGGIFSMIVLYMVTSSGEPIDGYAISKGVDRVSGGRIHIQAGTLYSILLNLENHGLVRNEMVPSRGGPARKVYTPTEERREAMRTGLSLLSDLVPGVQRNLREDWPALNVYG